MIDPRRGCTILFGLVAVAFAVRLLAGEVVLSRGRAFLPDSELYWGYAESLAESGTYQVGGAGARRTPAYPLFIVACTRLSWAGDPAVPPPPAQLRAVLVAQALLGALVVAMVWSLGRSLSGGELGLQGTAALAALTAALDPFAVSIGAMVLSETLFTAAMVAAVWCGVRASAAATSRSLLWTGSAGALAGVAVLTRPSGLLLVPMGLAIAARQWGMKASLLFTVAFAAVMMPWVVRNAAVYGAFVPTTLNVGESLYDGWNPEAAGGSDMAFVDRRKLMHGHAATPAEEVAEDAFWKREAMQWGREHPGRVVELAAVKLARYWALWPNAAEFRSRLVVVGCGLFSLLTYAGAAVGAVVLWRRGRRETVLLALAPAVYFALLHAVFVSSVRYRVPAMPIFELLTGVGLAWALRRARAAPPPG